MASSISWFFNKPDRSMQPVFFAHELNYPASLEADSIHSGHFMISYVHDETDDSFDVPPNHNCNNNDQNQPPDNSNIICANNWDVDALKMQTSTGDIGMKRPLIENPIDATLSILLQHMSLAYSGKLTSPKWKHFKGIKVKLKDKIRLNNIIWREWYRQYIKKQKPVVCQFDIPVFEKIHSRPEAVVLEGKYWKRRLQCLATEYKKWRMFSRQKKMPQNKIDPIFLLDKSAIGQSTDSLFTDFLDILMPSICESNINDEQEMFSPFNDSFPDLMNEFLPPPDFIPYSREISQLGLGDIVQPRLFQLQPSFEDMNMEVDSLSPLPNYNNFLSNFNYIMMADPYLNSNQCENVRLTRHNYTSNSGNNFAPDPNVYFSTAIPQTPLNLTQIRSTSDSIISPLNLVQKGGGDMVSQTGHEFKPTVSQLQNAKLERERTSSGGMLAPESIVGGNQNDVEIGEEPRRASTGSSPILYRMPKKHVSFALPNSTNNEMTTTTNYLPCQLSDFIGRPPCSNAMFSPRLPLKPITRKNSNSILELLLSNDSCWESNPVLTPQSVQKFDPSMSFEDCSYSYRFSSDGAATLLQPPIAIGNVLSKPSPQDDLKQTVKKIDSGSEKDSKRNYHTTAEHQRRCNIKQGFEVLNKIVPDLNRMNGCKINKATTLIKTAECCRKMRTERERVFDLARDAKLEIEKLQEAIRQLQMKLPASGIRNFGPSRSIRLEQLFDEFVRDRSAINWKFWIFSLVVRCWFTSYNETVREASRDEMFKSLFNWLHQCCSLTLLRPEVLKTMAEISRVTSILTDPSRVSREASEAARTAYSLNGARSSGTNFKPN